MSPSALGLTLLTVVLSASPTFAQGELRAFGSDGQRGESSLVVVRIENGKFAGLRSGMFITYGKPKWKPDYAEKVDAMTKGKIFRLGKDNWATLDNYTPVTMGGVTIPAGLWYLAIARDEAGAWSLVVIDPAKAKAAGATPPAPEPAPRTHVVPLRAETVTGKVVEEMRVSLERDATVPGKGELVIAWGDRKVSASFQLQTETDAPSAEPKQEAPRKKTAAVTPADPMDVPGGQADNTAGERAGEARATAVRGVSFKVLGGVF